MNFRPDATLLKDCREAHGRAETSVKTLSFRLFFVYHPMLLVGQLCRIELGRPQTVRSGRSSRMRKAKA